MRKFLSAVCALCLISPLAMGQVSMQGEGSVSAVPDMATINFTVVTQDSDASGAMTKNASKMASVLKKAKEFSIDSKDVRTTQFGITPVYKRNSRILPNGREISSQQLTGYRATNRIVVKVRDLKNFGKVIDGLVGEGANRVDGLQFGFSNLTDLRDKARKAAVKDAHRKASLYVKELNTLGSEASLGSVSSMSESMRYYGGYRTLSLADSGSTPIAAGAQTVTVNVNITWKIK